MGEGVRVHVRKAKAKANTFLIKRIFSVTKSKQKQQRANKIRSTKLT